MKKKKSKPMITANKKLQKIIEFYYMTPTETDAKSLSLCIHTVSEEKIEVWRELNLMEVILDNDSLIFQDASECFVDPLDLEFIHGHKIKTMYQISYDAADSEAVKKIMSEIITHKGGFICSDTDSFEPIYTKENMDRLGEEE